MGSPSEKTKKPLWHNGFLVWQKLILSDAVYIWAQPLHPDPLPDPQWDRLLPAWTLHCKGIPRQQWGTRLWYDPRSRGRRRNPGSGSPSDSGSADERWHRSSPDVPVPLYLHRDQKETQAATAFEEKSIYLGNWSSLCTKGCNFQPKSP